METAQSEAQYGGGGLMEGEKREPSMVADSGSRFELDSCKSTARQADNILLGWEEGKVDRTRWEHAYGKGTEGEASCITCQTPNQ